MVQLRARFALELAPKNFLVEILQGKDKKAKNQMCLSKPPMITKRRETPCGVTLFTATSFSTKDPVTTVKRHTLPMEKKIQEN